MRVATAFRCIFLATTTVPLPAYVLLICVAPRLAGMSRACAGSALSPSFKCWRWWALSACSGTPAVLCSVGSAILTGFVD
jgi:hypothetical protein